MDAEQASPTAGEKAATLETAGIREAAVLETAGTREARTLEAAGRRDALILASEGQCVINVIWENTQRTVALAVTYSSIIVASFLAIFGRWLGTPDLQLAAIVFLFGVANLITGFYFGRTNHARTGGVGGDLVKHDR